MKKKNHYFERLKKEGFSFDGLSPDALVEKWKQRVEKTRQAYREFWGENVRLSKDNANS